jgi:nucleoside 2-deoxyribosyltransferase
VGLETYLPHRDGKELLPTEWSPNTIFKVNVQALDQAAIVITNLNGAATDDGTAWELGYAYARGKHLVGVHTDMRLMFEGQIVNLMIECSLHKLVHSLDDLVH